MEEHGDRLPEGPELARHTFVDRDPASPLPEPELRLPPAEAMEPPDVGMDLGP